MKAPEEPIYGGIKSDNENALYSSRSRRNLLRFLRKKIKCEISLYYEIYSGENKCSEKNIFLSLIYTTLILVQWKHILLYI